MVETVEPRFARWTVGAESTLVGLSPDVEFSEPEENRNFYAVKGYKTGLYEDENPVTANYHTYLNWDYEQRALRWRRRHKGRQVWPWQPSSNRHAPLVLGRYGEICAA